MRGRVGRRGHAPGTAAIALVVGASDEQRSSRVLDVLLEPELDVEQVIVGPGGRAHGAPLNLDERRVVVFCWTTAFNAAEPAVSALADRADHLGIGLGVRLDQAVPSTGMTTYDLSGWRSKGRIFSRLLGERLVLADVVAAVRAKMAGRDPPTPSQVSYRVRQRLIVWLLALGAAGGIAGAPKDIWDLVPKPRFNEREAWSEIKQGDCPAVRAFVRRFPDGAHSQEARDVLAARVLAPVTLRARTRRQTRWSTSLDIGTLHRDRAAAIAAIESPARDASTGACRAMAEATGATLMGVEARRANPECHRFNGGWACAASGAAECRLLERQAGEPREVCRLPDGR